MVLAHYMGGSLTTSHSIIAEQVKVVVRIRHIARKIVETLKEWHLSEIRFSTEPGSVPFYQSQLFLILTTDRGLPAPATHRPQIDYEHSRCPVAVQGALPQWEVPLQGAHL